MCRGHPLGLAKSAGYLEETLDPDILFCWSSSTYGYTGKPQLGAVKLKVCITISFILNFESRSRNCLPCSTIIYVVSGGEDLLRTTISATFLLEASFSCSISGLFIRVTLQWPVCPALMYTHLISAIMPFSASSPSILSVLRASGIPLYK